MSTFSLFKSHADKSPVAISLDRFAGLIVDGEWAAEVAKVRAAEGETRKQLKTGLPAVTVSGLFVGGHKATDLQKHSGLLCMDFDVADNPNLKINPAQIRDWVAEDKYSRFAFLSCSGVGLAVICAIDSKHHLESFKFLEKHFKSEFGLIADRSGKNINRLRFVSWDDGAVLKMDSEVVDGVCYVEHIEKSLHTLPTLHNKASSEACVSSIDSVERTKLAQEFLSRFNEHNASSLYTKLIEHNFTAHTGKRNNLAIAQATMLFDATALPVAQLFIEAFYWNHCALFTDSVEIHFGQAAKHWENIEKNYLSTLSNHEAQIHELLETDSERDLFRICRALSKRKGNELPAGAFPLSAEQCRLRLGMDFDPQADRLLKKFIGLYGILELVTPGKRRTKGQQPRATVYRWRLS